MHIVLNPLNADLAAAEECRLLTRFPRDMHQRIRTAIFGADRDDLMRLRNVSVVSTATAFFVLTSRLASPPATPTCASALPSGLSAGCTPAFRLQTNGMAIHTYGPASRRVHDARPMDEGGFEAALLAGLCDAENARVFGDPAYRLSSRVLRRWAKAVADADDAKAAFNALMQPAGP